MDIPPYGKTFMMQEMGITISSFRNRLLGYFRQLTLAVAYLNIGLGVVRNSRPDASIQLLLDKDIKTEPMYLKDLLGDSQSVEQGILEIYQNKFVAAWSDLLNDLFAGLVKMHFEGVRQFSELKKKSAKIDFASSSELKQQIMIALVADFGFDKYADRVKLLNAVLNPGDRYSKEFSVIKKHVFIRNSVQHHNSLVYVDMLRDLGTSALLVMNANADELSLSSGEFIRMAIPELDLLKRSLILVSNEWSANCA